MAKHKIRNTFYWITCKCKHSLLMKLVNINEINMPVYFITKEKKIKKFYKNCDLKTSSRSISVCKELSTTYIEIFEASSI